MTADPETDAAEGPPEAGIWYFCDMADEYLLDETETFGALVRTACASLEATNAEIYQSIRLAEQGGRYDYDGETGLMRFTDAAGHAHDAKFQRVGTWLPASGSFMWNWGQTGERVQGEAVDQARSFGQKHDMPVLTSKMLWVDEADAWHLTDVVAYLSGLPMTYRAKVGERTWTYFALERPERVG